MARSKFRLVREDDTDTAEALHMLTFPHDEWEDNDAYWVVYDPTGTPVAFCTARFSSDDSVYLSRAGVLPIANGQGLQRRMITARVNWARREGRRYCVTYTLPKNYPSMVNLLRSGFKFYHPVNRWGGEDSHYFIKDLGEPTCSQ